MREAFLLQIEERSDSVLAPEISGVAEELDFRGHANGEESEGDDSDGEARVALRELRMRTGCLIEKTSNSGSSQDGRFCFAHMSCAVGGFCSLMGGYSDPTALAGPHKAEVLLRSGHYFLLLFVLMRVGNQGR